MGVGIDRSDSGETGIIAIIVIHRELSNDNLLGKSVRFIDI
jgi:hypothetical protein